MRKFLLFLGILLGLTVSGCQGTAQTSDTEEQDEKKNNTEDSLESLLRYLASDELKGRATGGEGIDLAAKRIEKTFRDHGIQPYYDSYRDTFQVENHYAYNIVGFVEGSDPVLKDEFILVGAHYDHIGEGKEVNGDFIANGANDNAAGTVALVELAKHFAKIKENKRSLMFMLFSAEEMGLQGSKYAAEKLKREGLELYAVLNFEMIGVPMEGKDYLAYVTGYESSNLAEKFNEYSQEEVLGYLPQAKEFKLFQRSDNFPFYQEFKIPAQTISTFDFTNYEYYHHVSDEAGNLDFVHMKDLIDKVKPGIYKMANTQTKEIKLNEQ
ncbi:MAG TPA: M20/M25/M40 family metallo-hydrolase [Salegentibacter sp.]|uniref:M20/M25/M40 family metallo-hydrolase n=1 Tax=Salegentibacter sp. TaxID=1903072 RepID=UPI002F93101D